ncbi:MAG: hypothetical protein M1816_003422 [Peltula sp. TS41687]|nr:MAG: hypothetical protein M1816_003422 [Peltula sp. TS41687]
MANWRSRGYVDDSEDDGQSKEEDEEKSENERRSEDGKNNEGRRPIQSQNPSCSGAVEDNDHGFRPIDDFPDKQEDDQILRSDHAESQTQESPNHAGHVIVVVDLAKGAPFERHIDAEEFERLPSQKVSSPPFYSSNGGEHDLHTLEPLRVQKQPIEDYSARHGLHNTPEFSSSADPVFSLSSLTRASSTPITSPLQENSPSRHGIHQRAASLLSESEEPITSDHQVSGRGTDDTATFTAQASPLPATRSLRRRNPIQLHPYLIEGERYRQTLKSRGVKPLRFTGTSECPPLEAQPSALQDVEFQPDDDTQVVGPTEGLQSSPMPSEEDRFEDESQDAARRQHTQVILSSPSSRSACDPDDFPDIDFLLRSDLPGALSQGFKRRKVTHVDTEKPRKRSLDDHLLDQAGSFAQFKFPEILTETTSEQQSVFDLPLSPPPSSTARLPNQVSIPVDAGADPAETSVAYGNHICEVEEDNRIDRMLPSRPRSLLPKDHHSSRKRQTKLTELSEPVKRRRVGLSGTEMNYKSRSKSGSHFSATDTRNRDRPSGKRKSVPKLSIVDAPKVYDAASFPEPKFVRIALRRVFKRKDKGRHSPTRKLFRLATRQDTEEVQTVLHTWFQGEIKPVEEDHLEEASDGHRQRQPLSLVSGTDEDNIGAVRKPWSFAQPMLPFTLSGSPQSKATPGHGEIEQNQSHVSASVPSSKTFKVLHPLRRPLLPIKNPPFVLPWKNQKVTPRPAQLESTATRYRDKVHRPDFGARLAIFDREYQKQLLENPTKAKPQLGRYLSENDSISHIGPSPKGKMSPQPSPTGQQQGTRPSFRSPARARKRAPHRIDAQTVEFRQPAEVDIQVLDDYVSPVPSVHENLPILHGLGPFGNNYSVSFNIVPLEIGTFFHESTFIGSGDFAKALQKDSYAGSEIGRGHIAVHFCSETCRWAAWNETVSSDLQRIVSWACQLLRSYGHGEDGVSNAALPQELSSVLRGVSRYLYDGLAFYDPIDRTVFVRTFSSYLRDLSDTLSSMRTTVSGDGGAKELIERVMIHVSAIVLVLAYQTYRIARQGASDPEPGAEATASLRSAAYQLMSSLKPADLNIVRNFYEENQRHVRREAGIREQDYKIEGLVVAYHVLARTEVANLSFWDMVHALLVDQDGLVSSHVPVFERIWNSVFTLLPLQELDEFGVLRTGRRFQSTTEGWCIPRTLSSRLFSIYSSNPKGQSPKFNSYCRSIFARCHYLLTAWGWRKFQDIVGTLFDFFAAHNLTHLHNEESRGSLRLLEVLDGEPNLDVQPQDPCFHILLKTIGLGLKALSGDYPERKVRNVVFRLIPNHGRQYPKEEAVHQKELDSLRNHHDLLCTLYWAAPPSARPSANIIRDLVDAETSHPEACRISLRAWVNLARFQLSTDEPTTSLDSFAYWHTMLIRKLLRQQDHIRAEIEAKQASMHAISDSTLAAGLLISTINQSLQPVDAVLIVALTSVRDAIGLSRCTEAAIALMGKASTADIFGLIETRRGNIHLVVVRSLEVVREYIRRCMELASTHQSDIGNEDSQDYGDWTALVEADGPPPLKLAAEHLQGVVHDALARLVSDAFGADKPPEETLLLQLVEVWVSTARMLVDQSLKQWNDYIGDWGHNSWFNLRKTEQCRKYTGHFMSKIIEANSEAYEIHKPLFLSSWMISLVERDSLLKFQHNLTNAILNVDKPNPLLKNLPFWFRARDGRYSITLIEFSERRLSLISSLLMNMREEVEELFTVSTNEASTRRREYAELLKALMGAMKNNYQELQQGNVISGAYVDFVQAVVEFLQQYTTDIFPVDKFFTDSTTFPLPAKDPTYVVGRLKNYGLKLSGGSVHKQLASFVQSVSERAAIDNQQTSLSMQLGDAMASTFEDSVSNRPTLRSFLMRAVFPAYIEHAFNSAAGWILAKPILQASTRMFSELLQDVDATNDSCVASVIDITNTFYETCRHTVELLIEHSELLEQPSILNALALIISSITASLPPLDYVQRISDEEDIYATTCLPFFSSFNKFILQVLTGNADTESPYVEETPDQLPTSTPYPEVRQFCVQELQESLSKNWVRHGEQLYVLRGNVRKQVIIHPKSFEEERVALLHAIMQFEEVLGRMAGLGDGWEIWRRTRVRRARATEDTASVVF